jgi:hypothetical protein
LWLFALPTFFAQNRLLLGVTLGANDGFTGAPLLNVEVVFGLKPPGLCDPPLLGNLLGCFSITTEFFP